MLDSDRCDFWQKDSAIRTHTKRVIVGSATSILKRMNSRLLILRAHVEKVRRIITVKIAYAVFNLIKSIIFFGNKSTGFVYLLSGWP
ncbi:hypothetical protein C7W93_09775 [Glaciimonas sp. PCH181]|nr:hypothetical protein C7W93_09775 [Glaciimonas sp. PCH181]